MKTATNLKAVMVVVFGLLTIVTNAQDRWQLESKTKSGSKMINVYEGKKQKVNRSKLVGQVIFYNSGEKQQETFLDQDGFSTVKVYYKNGALAIIGRSKQVQISTGYPIGVWKVYHKNGQLKQEVEHSDIGMKVFKGEVKEYYENGNLKYIGNVDPDSGYHGKMDGEWKYYDENGILKKTINVRRSEAKGYMGGSSHILHNENEEFYWFKVEQDIFKD